MTKYTAFHKSAALVWLACFLTVLTCLPVSAGHACCGNCTPATGQPMGHTAPAATDASCCDAEMPVEPECACTLQSESHRDRPPYALSHATTADSSLPVWAVDSAATGRVDDHFQPTANRTVRTDYRPRSGPIYLVNQTFLC